MLLEILITLVQDTPRLVLEMLSATVLNSKVAARETILRPPTVVVPAPFLEMMLFLIDSGPSIDTPPLVPVLPLMIDDSIVTRIAPIANTPAVPRFPEILERRIS